MKKVLILLLASTYSFACTYNVTPKEFNFWGYVTDNQKAMELILDKDKFSYDEENPDITLELDVKQVSKRFFKYARGSVNIPELDYQYSKDKICFMMNCHVNNLAKMLVRVAKKVNKSISEDCKVVRPYSRR